MAANSIKMRLTIANVVLFFVLSIQHGYSQELNLKYELLLSNPMLNDSIKVDSFCNSLEISPQNFITLNGGNQLYCLGWGGIVPFGKKSNVPIYSFTYTSDSLIFIVQDKSLSTIDKSGFWKSVLELKNQQMAISSGNEVIYIYDQKKELQTYCLYVLAKHGKYKKLLKTPKPIGAVLESGDSILISIESGLYAYNKITQKLNPLFALDKENTITSLTKDEKHGIIYFSTTYNVYALKNNTLIKLQSEFPNSIIKYFNGGLIVFNSKTKNIFRILNIEESLLF